MSKGKFAFTTEDYEIFEVCFKSYLQGMQVTVVLCINIKQNYY